MEISFVKQFYPDAEPIGVVARSVKDVIEGRLGLDVNDVLYFVSESGNDTLSVRGFGNLSAVQIGGLGGFPFQGLSGLRSVPGNGFTYKAVVIFYAADIDLNGEPTGDIGQPARVVRESMTNLALRKLMNNRILLDHISDLDYQMNFIEQILHRDQRRIRSADYPVFEAAEVIYEAIDNRIQLLFSKTNYNCRYVILAGGIHFKNQESNEAHFVFKRFECVEVLTKIKIDWTRIGLGTM